MRFVPTKDGTLAPFDRAAHEFIATRASAEPMELELLHDRDMFEHRKIFAQINEVAKALHRDPEQVRAELLYKTGNFRVMGELFGKTLISINSMSRQHMRDHELHQFWHDAVEIILADLLPQVSDAELRKHLASTLSLEAA